MAIAWSYERAFCRHDGLLTADEQQRLRASRIAIAGMGGVGGAHLITLARLGIGRFTIADGDHFELPNVNRQHGARRDTLGRLKTHVMAEELRQINPEVELRAFPVDLTPDMVAEFLDGADLFVDGIDFFSLRMRRCLFRQAAAQGIHAITAAPLGFGVAWLVFDPNRMSFDDYFDLNDQQSDLDQLAAFGVGLAPAFLQRPYLDVGRLSLAEERGPCAGLACQLCAGVTAAEALKILLGRGTVRSVPYYHQFDAYRGMLRSGRLWRANRHPWQWVKRKYFVRKFSRESSDLGDKRRRFDGEREAMAIDEHPVGAGR